MAEANVTDRETEFGEALRLSRRLKAPREAVFRAFTDPAALAKWFGNIPLRPTNIPHLLNILLRTQCRGQRYLLSPFQHGVFGLCQVGLPPIVLDILCNQVVCTFSTQGPCVCNGSELAVIDQ